MPIVSIIYFTGSGNTAKLAEAVYEGVTSVAGVRTNLIAISTRMVCSSIQIIPT